ncbi:hypothetical protein JCM10207_000007 [Rhodosporidiobolus poonsookiae]
MPPAPDLDLLLLGTGTSSSIPLVGCLTDPVGGCHCCRSTLDPSDSEGQKNRRRNTSAVLRIQPTTPGEREKVVLIDCGKTFLTSAIEHWPKHGLREIDAVILTHEHADAILGLDDLRGWTLRGAIQPSIPIYLTQDTFDGVSKAFPYLTNAGRATGGGDIPALTWHVFDPSEPFELFGIEVLPLPVHHGKFFTTPPSPYFCSGFLFGRQICYLSDVSYIPQAVWSSLASRLSLPSPPGQGEEEQGKGEEEKEEKPRLKALVIDCLRLEPFTSHFGLGQAVAAARRMGAERNYLIGFGHRTSHALWLRACTALSTSPPTRSSLPPSPTAVPQFTHPWEAYNASPDPTLEDAERFTDEALRCVESWAAWAAEDEGGRAGKEEEGEGWEGRDVWVRPACDGLVVRVRREGVRDRSIASTAARPAAPEETASKLDSGDEAVGPNPSVAMKLDEVRRHIEQLVRAEVVDDLFTAASLCLSDLIALESVPYTQKTHFFQMTRDEVLNSFKDARHPGSGAGGKSGSAEQISEALAALAQIGFHGLDENERAPEAA